MSIDLATLRRLYPFDSHYLDVGGPRMHYVDEGDGPAVVMVHGNPTWSFQFRDLVKGLMSGCRVVAPDHIGMGLSEKPQHYAYTLGKHIENLELLLSHLDLKDVTLIVHDWGAAIGMGWAVRHCDRVRRLVVFNGAAFLCGKTPMRIRLCTTPVVGDLLVRGFNGFAWAACRMATKKPQRMTAEVRGGYLFPYGNWRNRVGIMGFIRDIPRSPRISSHAVLGEIESRLERLRDHPMLICWGAGDFCFHDEFLKGWVDRFPQAQVHRYEDAGHYVVEDAHERILPLLRTFMEI